MSPKFTSQSSQDPDWDDFFNNTRGTELADELWEDDCEDEETT